MELPAALIGLLVGVSATLVLVLIRDAERVWQPIRDLAARLAAAILPRSR